VAPYGVDERKHSASIDLPAEVADVDIHQVRQRVAIGLPHVLAEVNAAHDFTSAAHQGLENRVFLRGEAEGDAPARDRGLRGSSI